MGELREHPERKQSANNKLSSHESAGVGDKPHQVSKSITKAIFPNDK